mgnify:CR=1 FL=1
MAITTQLIGTLGGVRWVRWKYDASPGAVPYGHVRVWNYGADSYTVFTGPSVPTAPLRYINIPI